MTLDDRLRASLLSCRSAPPRAHARGPVTGEDAINSTEIPGIGSLILLSLLGLAPVQAQTSLEGRFITGMPVPDEALSRAVATTAPKWFHPGRPMRADPVSDYDGGAAGLTNLTTGDLNNDGHPDIAAAHGYRKAGIYLHTGGRTFAAEQVPSERWWPVAANVGATSIAPGDLDQDGNLDVVIPLYWDHYRGHLAQFYRGRGHGTFEIWPVDG